MMSTKKDAIAAIDDRALLHQISKHCLLFNPKCEFYKNNVKRAEAWAAIASKLNRSQDACKRRWKIARARYSTHKKNLKKATGLVPSKYRPNPIIQHMSFMETTEVVEDISSNKQTTASQITNVTNESSKFNGEDALFISTIDHTPMQQSSDYERVDDQNTNVKQSSRQPDINPNPATDYEVPRIATNSGFGIVHTTSQFLGNNDPGIDRGTSQFLAYNDSGIDRETSQFLSNNDSGIDRGTSQFLSNNDSGIDRGTSQFLSNNDSGIDRGTSQFLRNNDSGIDRGTSQFLGNNGSGIDQGTSQFLSNNDSGIDQRTSQFLGNNDSGIDQGTSQFLSNNDSSIDRKTSQFLSNNDSGVDRGTSQFLSNNDSSIDRKTSQFLSNNDSGVDRGTSQFLSNNDSGIDQGTSQFLNNNDSGIDQGTSQFLSNNDSGIDQGTSQFLSNNDSGIDQGTSQNLVNSNSYVRHETPLQPPTKKKRSNCSVFGSTTYRLQKLEKEKDSLLEVVKALVHSTATSTVSPSAHDEEIDLFFRGIASTVRKLPRPIIFQVMTSILSTITQVESEVFGRGQSE